METKRKRKRVQKPLSISIEQFFSLKSASVLKNPNFAELSWKLIFALKRDAHYPSKPEHIYNSHYGNGVPAMFTS